MRRHHRCVGEVPFGTNPGGIGLNRGIQKSLLPRSGMTHPLSPHPTPTSVLARVWISSVFRDATSIDEHLAFTEDHRQCSIEARYGS